MNVRIGATALILAAGSLAVGACSSDSATSTSGSPGTTAMTESTARPTSTMGGMTGGSDTTPMASDIVDTAIAAGDFTTLVAAVQAAGLESTLRGPGPYTVFAPTDDAFAALPAGTLDTLLADPTGDLAGILGYHVVEGEVLAEDVAGLDGQPVTTVNGATFTVNVGADGSVSLTDATGASVTVVTTDIEASNGIVHVIDGVLLPG